MRGGSQNEFERIDVWLIYLKYLNYIYYFRNIYNLANKSKYMYKNRSNNHFLSRANLIDSFKNACCNSEASLPHAHSTSSDCLLPYF